MNDVQIATIKLKKIRTCGGCINYDKCKWIIQKNKNDKKCDWAPSKYRKLK